MGLSDQQKDQLENRREGMLETFKEGFTMSERQVSAHYDFRDMKARDQAEKLRSQTTFDLDEADPERITEGVVESACRQRFEEDHDLTFSTDYYSVQKKGKGRWSCTVMTNQT